MLTRRNLLRSAGGVLVMAPFVCNAKNLMKVEPVTISTQAEFLSIVDALNNQFMENYARIYEEISENIAVYGQAMTHLEVKNDHWLPGQRWDDKLRIKKERLECEVLSLKAISPASIYNVNS